MDDSIYRARDLRLKTITTAAVVLGVVMGLWKYFDTAEREFRRPYWEQQISLYFEATSAASALASSEDDQSLREARESFWRLYYGPLALVEDQEVANAMVEFGDALDEAQSKPRLKALSLNLAHTCRRSIGRSWNIPLKDLEGRSE